MDDSAIVCDEIGESYEEETKTIPISFNDKEATFKMQNWNLLLAFLVSTIALLISVSMKIKFNSDDELPLNQTIEIPSTA